MKFEHEAGREPRKNVVLKDIDSMDTVREAIAQGFERVIVDGTRFDLRVKGDWILFRRVGGLVPCGQLGLRR